MLVVFSIFIGIAIKEMFVREVNSVDLMEILKHIYSLKFLIQGKWGIQKQIIIVME